MEMRTALGILQQEESKITSPIPRLPAAYKQQKVSFRFFNSKKAAREQGLFKTKVKSFAWGWRCSSYRY